MLHLPHLTKVLKYPRYPASYQNCCLTALPRQTAFGLQGLQRPAKSKVGDNPPQACRPKPGSRGSSGYLDVNFR